LDPCRRALIRFLRAQETKKMAGERNAGTTPDDDEKRATGGIEESERRRKKIEYCMNGGGA
jgi:hypothetical protein